MLRHGIPPEIVTALRAVSAGFRALGLGRRGHAAAQPTAASCGCATARCSVLHRPGHSPSDTVLYDESQLDAAGRRSPDRAHLLQPAARAPARRRAATIDGPRPQALVTYIASLRADARDGALARAARPRRPIVDHAALIDERLRLHERRAEKIRAPDRRRSRARAHEIAHELWGNVAVTQAYLTLSEVLGHVDLLLADGRVVERETDGVVRFAKR